jgi:DNA-binding response OmpR family regulator
MKLLLVEDEDRVARVVARGLSEEGPASRPSTAAAAATTRPRSGRSPSIRGAARS